jgi:hypothetical protein
MMMMMVLSTNNNRSKKMVEPKEIDVGNISLKIAPSIIKNKQVVMKVVES